VALVTHDQTVEGAPPGEEALALPPRMLRRSGGPSWVLGCFRLRRCGAISATPGSASASSQGSASSVSSARSAKRRSGTSTKRESRVGGVAARAHLSALPPALPLPASPATYPLLSAPRQPPSMQAGFARSCEIYAQSACRPGGRRSAGVRGRILSFYVKMKQRSSVTVDDGM
jgi:hypothetical protein